MAGDLTAVIDDLRAESAALTDMVNSAGAHALATATPAAGWSVGDTIGHLWFFDQRSIDALTDPERFVAGLSEVLADPDGYLAAALAEGRAAGDHVLDTFESTRSRMIAAIRETDPQVKVPWYGPPMGLTSFATARLMETWAHGQDVADALGVVRAPSNRLRHICHLGVRTRGFSYAIRGRTAPDVDVFVSLTGPEGDSWEWGEPAAADRVEGPALDFCLLVTQRRHLADLSLRVAGEAATEWLSIAQAFAGTDTLTDPARIGLSATQLPPAR